MYKYHFNMAISDLRKSLRIIYDCMESHGYCDQWEKAALELENAICKLTIKDSLNETCS